MDGKELQDSEFIRQIARKVMGWQPSNWLGDHWEVWRLGDGKGYIKCADFNPLTNANHWMMVVEKMREAGFNMVLNTFIEKGWSVQFEKASDYYFKFHKSIGHAVCLAAIAALEGK